MKVVFASNNAHKLDEVRMILPLDIEVLGLCDVGGSTLRTQHTIL